MNKMKYFFWYIKPPPSISSLSILTVPHHVGWKQLINRYPCLTYQEGNSGRCRVCLSALYQISPILTARYCPLLLARSAGSKVEL